MAACKWYEASQVPIDPGYIYPGSQPGETYRSMGVDIPRRPESGVSELKQIDDTLATWSAMNEAANLNKIAAKWTACSVALNALSAICALA